MRSMFASIRGFIIVLVLTLSRLGSCFDCILIYNPHILPVEAIKTPSKAPQGKDLGDSPSHHGFDADAAVEDGGDAGHDGGDLGDGGDDMGVD
mmetsp:Transcript_15935/g.29703  ORF Transcript_15935/g.29703 Transcript_15935/m.29703 type:complete len:93 (-) Transcript_15935:4-282(-)